MINTLLRIVVKGLLRLRYRVRRVGADAVLARGRTGILFLPNHPALIDPIIVLTWLHHPFAPRVIADADQIDRFFIRWVARRIGARPLPDLRKHGPGAAAAIEAVLRESLEGLRRGENLVLYPSGALYRSRCEDLRGNSAVERILRELPDVRVVLVRTRGLWGSSFSLAAGRMPNVAENLRRQAVNLLKSLFFFAPRRPVTLELYEPPDLPRDGPRAELNRFLERYYNDAAPPALYVPYTPWERGGPRELPDPVFDGGHDALARVPATTRQLVYGYLAQATGRSGLRDEDRLAQDLGLDSLAKTELALWLSKEFGLGGGDVDALQTVGDVLLAARGETVVVRPVELKPVPARWLRPRPDERLRPPPGDTVTAAFLAQAARDPGRVAVADQVSGARTYRDLITAVLALRPQVEALPGERVGILLPASVAAAVTYLTALFAGKVPVMINWTTGARNMAHALELTGVQRVLTAGPVVARLESQGTDLSVLRDRFAPLEALRARIGRGTQLAAAWQARTSWGALERVRVPQTAAILLTSGSEALPKAVPLTHANILANLRDVLQAVDVRSNDRLIGFLPPFHSFGLTVTMVLPLVGGAPVVYHANPTEAWVLARLIEAYRATLLVGTPTFLAGIVRARGTARLDSLRLAVTGAEKCPERTYAALRAACPQAVILEGYGITECGPIVAVNRVEDPRPGTIGRVLPSMEFAVVDPDTGRPVPSDTTGLLLVRGPNVFPGYLGTDVSSPFVEFDGRSWYRTGDLVSAAADGTLTFRGRLKRFVKLGGEMVSLPAIAAVLEEQFASDADEGPVLAVTAAPDADHPEIVLFTTRDIDRPTANQLIRAAGLSPLHNVSRVERVAAIPVLGTGKTDYRALAELLRSSAAAG